MKRKPPIKGEKTIEVKWSAPTTLQAGVGESGVSKQTDAWDCCKDDVDFLRPNKDFGCIHHEVKSVEP